MPYPRPASRTVGSPPSPPHDSRFPPNIPQPPRPPSSTSTTPSLHRRGGSANPKPSSIPFPVKSPDLSKPSAAPGPLTPTSPSRPSFSSDKSSQKKASVSGDTIKVVTQGAVTSSFLDHASDDAGSEFGGLAYAQSDESDDDALLARVMGRTSGQVHHSPTASSTYSDDAIRTEQTSMEHGLDSALAALLTNAHVDAARLRLRSANPPHWEVSSLGVGARSLVQLVVARPTTRGRIDSPKIRPQAAQAGWIGTAKRS